MDQAAILDHEFRVAAYVVTWVLQLAYLAWLGIKWRSQKREAARAGRGRR
jgi:threonine/homoserine/homoserine lactone efflux protein